MINDFFTLKTVDTVLELIFRRPSLASELMPLDNALGRTLAVDCIAKEDIPPLTRSTMDGFAVRAQDVFGASEGLPALLDYVGECHMGEISPLVLQAGQAIRIWTGGMIPEGANAVVMLEYTQWVGQKQVEIMRPVAPLENCIERGEDASYGATVLGQGHVLRPQSIGILAALGMDSILVYCCPKVAIISSGDEIVSISEQPKPGQIRDINAHTLGAFIRQCGGESRFFGLVRDDKEALQAHISHALEWADIVLLSGGSSVGSRDFTLEAIRSFPESEIVAHGIAISPGKPIIFATIGDKTVWGLPGHAASALVCTEVFIHPLIKQLSGQKQKRPIWEQSIRARLTRSVSSAQGRRDYIRVTLEPSDDYAVPLLARPVMGKSGLISTLIKADGLVICPENQEGLEQGDVVPVHIFPGSSFVSGAE